ncbi:MAG: hypothetical protein HY042_11005 [Spirochaetia bacterium]|nr:hypothetical protein [Spirochaetia bacterium]
MTPSAAQTTTEMNHKSILESNVQREILFSIYSYWHDKLGSVGNEYLDTGNVWLARSILLLSRYSNFLTLDDETNITNVDPKTYATNFTLSLKLLKGEIIDHFNLEKDILTLAGHHSLQTHLRFKNEFNKLVNYYEPRLFLENPEAFSELAFKLLEWLTDYVQSTARECGSELAASKRKIDANINKVLQNNRIKVDEKKKLLFRVATQKIKPTVT